MLSGGRRSTARHSAAERWTLRANAKVTLALDVGPARGDGWHPVDIVLQRIGLGDAVAIGMRRDGGPSRVAVQGQGLHQDTLATRALALVEQELARPLSVDVEIAKQVPVGAGLGGGSADAAAVLQWAGAQHPELRAALPRLAAAVGTDVVFLVGDAPLCRATGRGEVLCPIDGPPSLFVAVAHPGFGLATPEVYRAFDRVGSPDPPRADEVVDALRRGVVPSHVGNQLEAAALAVSPALSTFRALLLRYAPPERTTLSGSGSAFVTVASHRGEAKAVADAWRAVGVPFVWWGEASTEVGDRSPGSSRGAGGPAQ